MRKTVISVSDAVEYIGLDVGEKRIGVARVNTAAKLPEALEPITVGSSEPFSAVLDRVNEYDANGIVIGLPRGLDGQETAQTRISREFAEELHKQTELPVYLIDEAVTSVTAKERIKNGASGSIDSVAACIILEDFIMQNNAQSLWA